MAEPKADSSASTRVQAVQSLGESQATLKAVPGQGQPAHAAVTPLEILPGYDILGELGRGGMGVVYQAKHLGLGRLVALKMIRDGVRASDEDRNRFLTEARTVARLLHPNIVQIFDVGIMDGMPYCALELVEGGSLESRIRHQPQPPREAAKVVATLARAMQAVHEQGIIHRDLKPANILLAKKATPPRSMPTPRANPQAKLDPWEAPRYVGEDRLSDFVPKITDFGLAKRSESGTALTASGIIVGTPQYMAPEQASGHNRVVGPPADIHALGVILYEMLTGQLPYVGVTPLDILLLVQSEEPVPPRRRVPTVPRDLEMVCLKCLEKLPSRRYASCAALADDLERWLEERPLHVRPLSLAERWWRWAKRNPRGAAVVVADICLLAALAILALWFVNAWQEEQAARQQTATELQQLTQSQMASATALEQIGAQAFERWLGGTVPAAMPAAERALLPRVLQHWEASQPGSVQALLRDPVRGSRWALALARAGKTTRAAQTAAVVAPLRDLPPAAAVDLAQALALCAEADRETADAHAATAMQLLQRAGQAGHFQTASALENLLQEPDLQSLRARPDFQSFVQEMKKNAASSSRANEHPYNALRTSLFFPLCDYAPANHPDVSAGSLWHRI